MGVLGGGCTDTCSFGSFTRVLLERLAKRKEMKQTQVPGRKHPGKKQRPGAKAGHEGVANLPGKVFTENKAMVRLGHEPVSQESRGQLGCAFPPLPLEQAPTLPPAALRQAPQAAAPGSTTLSSSRPPTCLLLIECVAHLHS